MKAAAESARAASQRAISAQIDGIAAEHQWSDEPQPLLDYPPYRSSRLRHPKSAFVCVDPEEIEASAPCFGHHDVDPTDADLTAGHPGEPIGERIIVTGRVLDAAGKPVAGQLVEIWQANAAGRYNHQLDRHPAPIDPNFIGVGRCLTESGRDVSISHRQAGSIPMAEPRKRLAPSAHSLLDIRDGVHPAPGYPDVFSGRPVVRFGPHLPVSR